MLALERWVEPADWDRLRREAPDGFYLRAKHDVGAAALRAGPGPKGTLHVGPTHAIARYSWPLLPVATIALRGAPRHRAGPARDQPWAS